MLLEDLKVLFSGPDAVVVTLGASSFKGLLDSPDALLGEEMIVSTEFELTIETANFPSGTSTLSIAGVSYRVRRPLKIGDGLLTKVLLGKV